MIDEVPAFLYPCRVWNLSAIIWQVDISLFAMIDNMQISTYECPVVEVIELSTKDGVMQFGSPTDPGTGGGEGGRVLSGVADSAVLVSGPAGEFVAILSSSSDSVGDAIV